MPNTQNFQNHTRWYPLVHFVIMPLLLLNLIFQAVRLWQDHNIDRVWNIVLAFVLILITLAARLQALRAQDRVIRLEERLRFKELLSPELAGKAMNLKTSEMIALRFASDEELPELTSRVVAGEFASTKEIKQAIKNWRGDYLRV